MKADAGEEAGDIGASDPCAHPTENDVQYQHLTRKTVSVQISPKIEVNKHRLVDQRKEFCRLKTPRALISCGSISFFYESSEDHGTA